MTFFLLSTGQNQWAVKFQPYLVSTFRVIAIDNKNKAIHLYSEKNITDIRLSDRNPQVQWTTELGLVSFYSHELGHSSRYSFGLNTVMLLSKKAIAYRWQ